MILSATFAALSAVLSQISIPVGAVPINFTHISVFAAAGLIGPGYGALSQVIFVLLGAAGLPVFSGFHGGAGAIFGPTGGFIIGYIPCAFLTGFLVGIFKGQRKNTAGFAVLLVLAMYAGWFATYLCGISWFMLVTGTGLAAALAACLTPFIAGDVLKVIVCVFLIARLGPILEGA